MALPQMTTTVSYGLGACIALAKNGGKMSARSLASEVNASSRYMSQVLNKLRTGRIVKSTGGVQGGYRLSRSASKITVGQIIKSIEGPPSSIPENIPPKVRRQLKRACRELYAIRLSEL
jgi:Rrf2 family protein